MRTNGKTLNMMMNAPKNSIYVWCNSYLEYPRALAIKIGRGDLRIVGPSFIYPTQRYRGVSPGRITFDHSLKYKPADVNQHLLHHMDLIDEVRADNRILHDLGVTWDLGPSTTVSECNETNQVELLTSVET